MSSAAVYWPKPAQRHPDRREVPPDALRLIVMTRSTHTSRLGLTTSEAARHLGVSLSTVRRWSDMGYLRGYRTPGGQRRFPVGELDEFVASLEERTAGGGRFMRSDETGEDMHKDA
jgi:excisionase family DNA binding protein